MKTLLETFFNHDFSGGDVSARFFARSLTIPDLQKICAHICQSSIDIGGKSIPAAIRIPGKNKGAPFAILAQLHGNEPAGLAGILLAMALSDAGKLDRDVIGIIGNPLAAQQYFAAYDPAQRQETRDAYRCGLDENGNLLPDGNRIPVDFLTRAEGTAHIKRSQELFHLAQHISGILDIHSARGNMLCITDHKHDRELKDSPIRSILTGLAEAISAHASASVTVQTYKTIIQNLPNIQHQTGIEAGRHEDPLAPENAASFTLSLLHTLGITTEPPIFTRENGTLEAYRVQPRITYADLIPSSKTLREDDKIHMARHAEQGETPLITLSDGRAFVAHQYDEMEPILKNQIVAVAIPSGTVFSAPYDFSGIFLSKSAALYDKDPAVGPWPVASADLAKIKFCYPCKVEEMKISF